MNFEQLTKNELDGALRALLAESAPIGEVAHGVQKLLHELQVHQCELEIQNRTLRQAQDELEQSLQRYADLYDSLPIGYVTLAPKGRIIEANLTAAEMLGVARDQIIGSYLRQYIAAERASALAAHLDATLLLEGKQTIDTAFERSGKPPILVQISSRRHGSDSPVIRAALTDVTALKEAQRALEDIVAEQESFAYSISHDLRSPLLTISSFSKVLAEDGTALSAEERMDIVQRIGRAAGRMDELLQNLLEYSRVSRAQAKVEPLNIREIVTDVMVQLQGLISDSGAEIDVQASLPVALGSRTLFAQCVGNLLTNALKYSQKGRKPVIRITARETPRTVIFCVADEGIGIAPHHQERIFRIFERLHGLAEYPGTGIGLAIVRRAVERMRGRVWVESEEGKGSRFLMEVPKPEKG